MSIRLHYQCDGTAGSPPVFLGGALGTNLELFDHLAGSLSERRRVVRFDTRGHGRSPAPPGPYAMSDLAQDVVALADLLGIDRFAYVGISIGGAIGLTLALEHPERVSSLVVACAGPRFGDPATWRERAAVVAERGLDALVEPTTQRWFTPDFQARHPETVEAVMSDFAAQDPVGYAGCCLANAGYDVSDRLGEVAAPTRVVVASEDAGTPPETGRAAAEAMPRADLVVIENSAHLANLARPREFDAAVSAHLLGT